MQCKKGYIKKGKECVKGKMSKKSKSAVKVTSIVIISIILTAVLVSLVNVGMGIFLMRPDYTDYCDILTPPVKDVAREVDTQCYDDYDHALKDFNQFRFYIFTGIGFVLLLAGLFISDIISKVTGLSSGGILVIQGVVMNLQNKIAVFIALLALFVIFGFLGIKVVRRMQ